jgi:hypothetical protein
MACNEDEYRSKARARAQKNRCYRAPTGRARQAPTRLSNSAVFGCSCAIEHDVSVWPNAADNPAIYTYQLRNCHISIVMLRASARQPRAPRRRMASLSIALGCDASRFRTRRPAPRDPGEQREQERPRARNRAFPRCSAATSSAANTRGRTLREHLGLPRPANRLFQKRGL